MPPPARRSSSLGASLLALLAALLAAYLAFLVAAPNNMSAAPLQLLTSKLLPRAHRLFSPAASVLRLPFATASPSSIASRSFTSTTPAAFNMTHDQTTFKDAVKHRRTIYGLNKTSPIDDKKIEEILNLAIKEVPSSFNSQSARLVVLLKDEHDKFWDIVSTILKVHVPEDKWEHTASRMKMFADAYGTVRCSSPLLSSLRVYLANLRISYPTGPLLRRPRTHQSPPIQVPQLRRQVPPVVRAHHRHAPVHAVDGVRGGRARLQPAALQPAARPEGQRDLEGAARVELEGAAGVWWGGGWAEGAAEAEERGAGGEEGKTNGYNPP